MKTKSSAWLMTNFATASGWSGGRRGRISSVLTIAFASVLVACGVSHDESSDVARSELRVLDAAEIVGTIEYGQTRRVFYQPTPRYRALSFHAQAGDYVEIWVRGQGAADARAFLLTSSYATLASNNDATASTKDARITTKITVSGTYYIALRENDEETSPTSTFDVILSKTNVPPVTPPSPPVAPSPFDPSSCGGPPLAQSAIVAWFSPGTLGRRIFSGSIYGRYRTCTELGGCTPWMDSGDNVYLSRDFGQTPIRFNRTSLEVSFSDSVAPFGVELSFWNSNLEQDRPGYTVNEARVYDGSGHISVPSSDPSDPYWRMMVTFLLYGQTSVATPLELDVRSTCFRGVMKATRPLPQTRTESEFVVLGKITPP